MARQGQHYMSAGETLTIGCSLEGDLDDADTMTGEIASVTIWQLVRRNTFEDVSAQFTIAAQVNAAEFTPEDAAPVPVGKGIVARVTATETPGDYEVRYECDSANGDHPVSVRKLTVTGPGTPA